MPLSTLKLNARVLRDLNLVSFGGQGAILTTSGRDVVQLLREHIGPVLPIQEVKR